MKKFINNYVIVDINDIEFIIELYYSTMQFIPIGIIDKFYAMSYKKYLNKENRYLIFTEKDEVNFFRQLKFIVDSDKITNLDSSELIKICINLNKKEKKLIKKINNNLPHLELKEINELYNNYRKLLYLKNSILCYLNKKTGLFNVVNFNLGEELNNESKNKK